MALLWLLLCSRSGSPAAQSPAIGTGLLAWGMAVSVEVALLSGRSAHLRCEPGSSVEQLQLAAERELGVCVEHLITAEGALLRAEDSVVWEEGARLTARVRAPRLLGGQTAFALVKSDGSMVTWGLGGVSPQQLCYWAGSTVQ